MLCVKESLDLHLNCLLNERTQNKALAWTAAYFPQ